MHNLQTITKSHRSYEDAIKRFAKRGFIKLSLYGCGYTNDIRQNWESYLQKDNISEADDCYINIESLFDYGHPKIIEKEIWLYKNRFITIKFKSNELYYIYHRDGLKIGMQKDEHTMTVYWLEINIGLGDWDKDKIKELKELAQKCKPEVKEKILKAIDSANEEIKEWQKVLKKSLTGIIE